VHFCKIVKSGLDKHRELIKEMQEKHSSKTHWEIMNHNTLLAEWQAISEGTDRANRAIFFDVKKIKPIIIRFQNYLLKELSKVQETPKEKPEKLVLFLDKNGDFYKEPKKKYCYPMGEKSNRHNLIRFLVKNEGYQPTDFITTETGYNTNQITSVEIGKIRKNVKKYLGIKGKEFLEAKKDSGYRINPKYKIRLND
jgi:hypothetical protein